MTTVEYLASIETEENKDHIHEAIYAVTTLDEIKRIAKSPYKRTLRAVQEIRKLLGIDSIKPMF